MSKPAQISSGINELEQLLEGIFVGDNVIWHDDAGSLAWVFCYNFIKDALAKERPLIYVSVDRSPKNLIEKLGSLADHPGLLIMDCFTNGKGAGSQVFKRYLDQEASALACRIVSMDNPGDIDQFSQMMYQLQSELESDNGSEVRLVFESLTGMQEIWGGEEPLLSFYVRACPRLYELNTVAYWIIEKEAHSQRLKSQINQTAQVVMDLAIRRGTTRLSIIKAENREPALQTPHTYWTRGNTVFFHPRGRTSRPLQLGPKIKALRTKKGLSQSELARMVGVTASSISQIESDSIHPSLPALVRLAEVLDVEMGYFFSAGPGRPSGVVYPLSDSRDIQLSDLPKDSLSARLLVPMDFAGRAEPYLLEIPGGKTLNRHFFLHKGEEVGYLLKGNLDLKLDGLTQKAHSGDLIYLTSEIPGEWSNPGQDPAQILWIKLR
jgi:transcriptional regulator with XRE-family HTH domain/KaiC/GvpD/RAD55 family RecA-like ATPase